MQLSQTSLLLSLLLTTFTQTELVNAGPYPKDALHDLGFSFLADRSCASYCGTDNQFCCQEGESCYTNAQNVATCTQLDGARFAATGGAYSVYTTTWTETDLIAHTSTYSSWYGAAATQTYAAAPLICSTDLGETSCGTICCASNQRCEAANTCGAYTSTYIPTYASGAEPLRPTSGGAATATFVVSTTTTQGFLPPATASGSSLPLTGSSTSSGLSGGAIAGIVIGVIAGIILLLLFCFCCIIKTGFDGLLALFGLGKRRRRSTETVEVIEERYSRHGSGTGSRRNTHNTWFGASRPTRVTETRKKKSSGLGGLGVVGAGLIGLAVILGLKRKHDRNEKPPRSEVSGSSYYSYTDTSASSASSDRRTRDSRGTRGTRNTRQTRGSRR